MTKDLTGIFVGVIVSVVIALIAYSLIPAPIGNTASAPPKPVVQRGRIKVTEKHGDEIRYFNDPRTGLCYARLGVMASFTFTYVPCLDQVQQAIKDDKEDQ